MIRKKLFRSFVNKEGISEHLMCPICTEVMDCPMRAKCGHTFCCICIENWRQINKACPMCKVWIKSGLSLEKDLIPTKMIGDLVVECDSYGCAWTGKNSQLRGHFIRCKFRQTTVEKDYSRLSVINIEEGKEGSNVIQLD